MGKIEVIHVIYNARLLASVLSCRTPHLHVVSSVTVSNPNERSRNRPGCISLGRFESYVVASQTGVPKQLRMENILKQGLEYTEPNMRFCAWNICVVNLQLIYTGGAVQDLWRVLRDYCLTRENKEWR